jgi:cytochrome c-type biogenesis protein CcmH
MKRSIVLLLMLLSIINPAVLLAGVEVHQFGEPEQEQQYKKLIDELRCLVCQNQNLADSNSELAQDLRKQVSLMILNGQTDAEIIDYMVARYGDFVLYRPPFKPLTYVLWVGPFLLLFFTVFIVVAFIRKNKSKETSELDADETDKLNQLLNKESDKGNSQ